MNNGVDGDRADRDVKIGRWDFADKCCGLWPKQKGLL
jgi:hypothetical protein